ncbi:hypothetical protein [Salininema proteolyticum]|uniref:Lipoprotein n=1 Tax=Salininema proteolyticum TaxID=1607685 RepID=A0ABV8TXB9_9ACTN
MASKSRMRKLHRLAATGATVGLLGLTGCSDTGPEEAQAADITGGEADADPIAMLNETVRLETELGALERQAARKCMEDKGHTVHDESLVAPWTFEELDSIPDDYGLKFFPSTERAGKFGFGGWAYTDIAASGQWAGLAEEYQSAKGDEDNEDETGDPLDNSAFHELSHADQFAWYADFVGGEAAESRWGHLLDETGPRPETSEDLVPYGCAGEVIEDVYGDDADTSEFWRGHEIVYGFAFPKHVSADARADRGKAVVKAVEKAEGAEFFQCLGEAGYPGWEFDDEVARLSPDAYWAEGIYPDYTDVFAGFDEETVYPEAPDDLPSDVDELVRAEIAMGAAWARCNDETGLEDAMLKAFRQFDTEYYQGRAEEFGEYQEQLGRAMAAAEKLD